MVLIRHKKLRSDIVVYLPSDGRRAVARNGIFCLREDDAEAVVRLLRSDQWEVVDSEAVDVSALREDQMVRVYWSMRAGDMIMASPALFSLWRKYHGRVYYHGDIAEAVAGLLPMTRSSASATVEIAASSNDDYNHGDDHVADSFARMLGVEPPVEKRWMLRVRGDAMDKAWRRVVGEGKYHPEKPLVVVQGDSANSAKEVPWDRMTEIINTLQKSGWFVVLVGSRRRSFPFRGGCGWNAAGNTTFDELAGLVECAHAVVAYDSAVYHLATALQTPVVGIFKGPCLSPERVTPEDAVARVFYEGPPDRRHGESVCDRLVVTVEEATGEKVLGQLMEWLPWYDAGGLVVATVTPSNIEKMGAQLSISDRAVPWVVVWDRGTSAVEVRSGKWEKSDICRVGRRCYGVPRNWNDGVRRVRDIGGYEKVKWVVVSNDDVELHGGCIRRVAKRLLCGYRECGQIGGRVMAWQFAGRVEEPWEEYNYVEGSFFGVGIDDWELYGFDEAMGLGYSEDAWLSHQILNDGGRLKIVQGLMEHCGSGSMPGAAASAFTSRNSRMLVRRDSMSGRKKWLELRRVAAAGDALMVTPVAEQLVEQGHGCALKLGGMAGKIGSGLRTEWGGMARRVYPHEQVVLDGTYELLENHAVFRHPVLVYGEECGLNDVEVRPCILSETVDAGKRATEFMRAASQVYERGMGVMMRRVVGIGYRSGTRHQANWRDERWGEVFRQFPEILFVIVDHGMSTEEVQSTFGVKNVVGTGGVTRDLTDAYAILKRCHVIITVDTSLLHVASATLRDRSDRLILGLVGGLPGEARAYPGMRIWDGESCGLKCWPCREGRCPPSGEHCLDVISSEMVVEWLRAAMFDDEDSSG